MSYITYPTPTPEQFKQFQSETAKYRHLTVPYLAGTVLDIASQGDPVVPWAFSLDLPIAEYLKYNSGHTPANPIQLRGHADSLAVISSGSMDAIYSSHLIEDYLHWTPVLTEWTRVLKKGGHLVILLPDRHLWGLAIQGGQPPNCAHKRESWPGELSTYAPKLGLEVLEDKLSECYPGDYNIIFVGRKR